MFSRCFIDSEQSMFQFILMFWDLGVSRRHRGRVFGFHGDSLGRRWRRITCVMVRTPSGCWPSSFRPRCLGSPLLRSWSSCGWSTPQLRSLQGTHTHTQTQARTHTHIHTDTHTHTHTHIQKHFVHWISYVSCKTEKYNIWFRIFRIFDYNI